MTYDELEPVAKSMVDAVLGAYVARAMHEGDAVRIMTHVGMESGEAIELLEAERLEHTAGSPLSAARDVLLDYTNWRGERGERRVEPIEWHFASSEWHPEKQWLLRALDLDKDAIRHFAMKDIHSWRPAPLRTKD